MSQGSIGLLHVRLQNAESFRSRCWHVVSVLVVVSVVLVTVVVVAVTVVVVGELVVAVVVGVVAELVDLVLVEVWDSVVVVFPAQ